tara:strand:- start:807 stop:995 length:189 start_codon:yes stop_codon:yes gene_type:complete
MKKSEETILSKMERIVEHLEYLKVKEVDFYNKLDEKGNNKLVSFGKVQGFEEVIKFVKSEFS